MTSTQTPRRPSSAAPLDLAQISLRLKERGFVCGGTDAGKSTLADKLRLEFLHRYAARGARCLILDTKPRYRAQFQANGMNASHRYKGWDHGPSVPGSVVVDSPAELATAWKMGARTVIAQCERRAELARIVATARVFLESSRANRPQLVQVDESLDFFNGNGSARGGDDIIEQLARAGRERGTSALYCAQRTKGIPAALMGEMTRLYALRIDYVADAKRYQEMGAPPFPMPLDEHTFYYWFKGDYRNVYGPYKLTLPRR